MNSTKLIYVDSEVLNWEIFIDTDLNETHLEHRLPYKMWEHSEKRFTSVETKYDLIDVITNLKRVIDYRLKQLDKINNLKSIPIKDIPDSLVDILEYLGIIRPHLVNKLLSIRNLVEHEFDEPPDKDTCKEYLEFVWYYLRATDRFVRYIIQSFILKPPGIDPMKERVEEWVEVQLITHGNWIFNAKGWLPQSMVATELPDNNNYITLYSQFYETKKEWAERKLRDNDGNKSLGRGLAALIPPYFEKGGENDIRINAEIRGPAETMKYLLRLYFAL